jgi:hypothetical protein
MSRLLAAMFAIYKDDFSLSFLSSSSSPYTSAAFRHARFLLPFNSQPYVS